MESVAVPFTPGTTARRALRKRVAVVTLGCKVNAFESALMGQSLERSGWTPVPARSQADLYVINTCTVTREADRQARQEVRRAVRRNPEAVIVVTGCYAQVDAEACAAIPGVDLVVGNDRKLDLHALAPALERQQGPRILVGDLDEHVSLPDQLLGGYEGRTRAYVQVQQGCDQGCTFCIIHRARGPSRSLSPALVRRQVARLVDNGYREVVVCGVDLGAYGRDSGDGSHGLVDLLRELAGLEGDFRLRLSSIDPVHVDAALVELMAAQPKLCPHLHLSLQSGNSLILKRMKRRYTRELVYQRMEHLRRAVPDVVLSADVMAGFPTETEGQFLDTLGALYDLEIAYPHVFAYSERAGTPAARIPKQIPVPERKARARRLREAGERIRGDVMRRYVGRRVRVLVESGGRAPAGFRLARAAAYLPVHVPATHARADHFCEVRISGCRGDALVASDGA